MYIQFTKDINKIKNTVAFGMGVREIIIALATIVIALSEFFVFKKFIPTDLAYYPCIPTVLIGMFFMVYKKNGMRFEKAMFYKIKRILFSSKIKRYETENMYKEVYDVRESKKAESNKPKKAKK